MIPTAAHAIVVSHEHFTGDPYDCDSTPAQDSGTIHVTLTATQRGTTNHPFRTSPTPTTARS